MFAYGITSNHTHVLAWCNYGEWMGRRRRYGVVDAKECLRFLGGATVEQFRANYQGLPVAGSIADEKLSILIKPLAVGDGGRFIRS